MYTRVFIFQHFERTRRRWQVDALLPGLEWRPIQGNAAYLQSPANCNYSIEEERITAGFRGEA